VRFAQELVSYFCEPPSAPLLSQSAKVTPQPSSLFISNNGGSSHDSTNAVNSGQQHSVDNIAVGSSFINTPFTSNRDQEMYVLSDHSTQSAPATYPPTSSSMRPVNSNAANSNAYSDSMPSGTQGSNLLFKHHTLSNGNSSSGLKHRVFQGPGMGLMGNYQQLTANTANSISSSTNTTVNTNSNNSTVSASPAVMVGSTSSLLKQYGRTKHPPNFLTDTNPGHANTSSRNDDSSALISESNSANDNNVNYAVSTSSSTTNTTVSTSTSTFSTFDERTINPIKASTSSNASSR